ncbi:TPA: hypothetical protein ACK3JR_000068 [Mannheimia haemolytica]
MHSTFKLTLAALAVSVVLTGCKSSQGPSVIADNPPKQITAPDSENGKKSTSPKPQSKQPNRPTTTVNTATGNKTSSNPVVGNTPPAKDNTQPAPQSSQPNSDKATNAVPMPAGTHKKEEPSTSSATTTENKETNNVNVQNDKAPEEPKQPETTNTEKPQGNQTESNQTDNANNQPVEPPAKPENTDPEITFTHPAVNVDIKGKPFRIIRLNPQNTVVNQSDMRHAEADDGLADISPDSPFRSSEKDKEYNHELVFDLGVSTKENSYQNINTKGENHLGIHRGAYTDPKLEGNSQTINYLYVNQPYSSYGALFTDNKDSRLFSVHLTSGQKNDENNEKAYAEYGVFTGDQKWNDNLVGNAVYKGQAIARIIRNVGDEQVASLPEFDGNVTLNLNLTEDWDNSTLSGEIDSKSIGKKIILNNTDIRPASYISNNLRFGGEATVEGDDNFEGGYDVDFTGPNLEDAVGGVELENKKLKYNAVFGATKSAN